MTTTRYKKKLIEVAIPLEAINAASAREKSIRHGHPSTLHLWWARRPLAACRAVLFSQLVDDPSEYVDDLLADEKKRAAAEAQLAERDAARQKRAEEGTSLPAYGSDLNPVAVMIGKAMIEIPPKFKDMPPIHPGTKEKLSYRNAEGLAEDVKYYGEWMREKAWERIGHLYPQVDLPKEHGGGKATVIAWIWARTVPSPDPAFADVQVPIASSFLLSSKKGKEAWIEPIVDKAAKTITYRIKTKGTKAEIELAKEGTKAGRGANFHCILSSTAITPDYVKAKGRSGQMGQALIAIVAQGNRSRAYVTPSRDHEQLAAKAKPNWKPENNLPDDPRNFWTVDYGLTTFGDLFTDRQLVALNTFSDLVHEARAQIEKDALAAAAPADFTAFAPAITEIYRQVFAPGTHTLDTYSAMYACSTSPVGGGSATKVSELTDVDVTGIANGKVLAYNGSTSKWEPVDPTAATGTNVYFRVFKSANQTVPANTWTKLTWQTEEFDTNSNFASDRFTPTVAGIYVFKLDTSCLDGSSCYTQIVKNGVTGTQNQLGSANNGGISTVAIYEMNGSTDYVEANVFNGGGTAIHGGQAYSEFTGTLVGGSGGGSGDMLADGSVPMTGDLDMDGNDVIGAGAVGIGTAAPGEKLHVENGNIVINNDDDDSYIFLHDPDQTGWYLGQDRSDAGAFKISTYNTTTFADTRFTIDYSGNVGIGTTSPNAKLHVLNTQVGDIVPAINVDRDANTKEGAIAWSNSGTVNWWAGMDNDATNNFSLWNNGVGFALHVSDATNNIGVGNQSGHDRIHITGSGNNGGPAYYYGGGITIENTIPTITFYETDRGAVYIDHVNSDSRSWWRWTGETWFNLMHLSNTGYLSTAGGGAWSDRRLKKNIEDLPALSGLESINALRPVTFEWISENLDSGMQIGLVAQEVEEVYPALVETNQIIDMDGQEQEQMTVNYSAITVPLIKAVQELSAKVEAQQAEIEALKATSR